MNRIAQYFHAPNDCDHFEDLGNRELETQNAKSLYASLSEKYRAQKSFQHATASGTSIDVSTAISPLTREVIELRMRLAALEIEVRELRRERILAKDSCGSDNEPRLADVLSITHAMFPGETAIELTCDPEEEVPFVVITAKAGNLSSRELISKRLEWHERVGKLSPGNSGKLRLSLLRE